VVLPLSQWQIRPVAIVLPRPSDSGGSPIERKFRRSEVATKPDLKGNYLLARHASLHRNAITSDAVTRLWRRLSEAAMAYRPKRAGNESKCRSNNGATRRWSDLAGCFYRRFSARPAYGCLLLRTGSRCASFAAQITVQRDCLIQV